MYLKGRLSVPATASEATSSSIDQAIHRLLLSIYTPILCPLHPHNPLIIFLPIAPTIQSSLPDVFYHLAVLSYSHNPTTPRSSSAVAPPVAYMVKRKYRHLLVWRAGGRRRSYSVYSLHSLHSWPATRIPRNVLQAASKSPCPDHALSPRCPTSEQHPASSHSGAYFSGQPWNSSLKIFGTHFFLHFASYRNADLQMDISVSKLRFPDMLP